MSARQIAAKLSPRGWAMLGGSVAVAIVFLYVIFQLASAPSYTTLLTGLDPAQTGKITSTLSAKGIPYQLQNNGTAIGVQSGQTAQARVALAGAGELGSSQPGFELFDKSQLGASNFQQQITYQRALEGQLDQTIDTIQGVSSAQVQLVLPNPQAQLFAASNSQPVTGAVLLSTSGSLDPSSVKGIAQLVASSVPGLALDKVTITDSSGQLLWPNAGAGSGGDSSLLAKESAESQYDSTMAATATSMLAQTLGAGKAQVIVNADLNADQSTSDTLTYAKKGVPVQQHQEAETLKGTGTTNGAAGTTGNIPGYAQTGGANSNYNHKVTDTTYGVNKTVTHSVIAPGAVNRQSVSVLVDKSVPATALPAVRAAVSSAVGLNTKRGDVLSFGQLTFAKPATTTPTAGGMTKYMSYAKYGVIGLASIVFLFFISRMLRKREREEFAQPTWVSELTIPRPIAAIEAAPEPVTPIAQLKPPVNVAKQQIAELVERDPDRVAQQVRAWMTEE